jgi:hypothetical protein
MKITIVKAAQKHSTREVCPWMVSIPPEGKK